MSVEAVWDLQAKASPRSLAVFSVKSSSSHHHHHGSKNPFDTNTNSSSNIANNNNDAAVVACVFGTDRGSLHYRTYATTLSGVSSLSTAIASQGPLGTSRSTKNSQQQQQHLPRHYYPMDLGSLPGPVLACLHIPHHKRQQTFLLLMDDSRGSGTGGTYASLLVSSSTQSPGFVVLQQQQQQQLPRMSCADCYVSHGYSASSSSATMTQSSQIVYGAGRTIRTLDPQLYEQQDRKNNPYKNKRLVFDKVQLPAAIRSGQDALVVTSQGKVVVVAVGNAFYAVAGMEADEQVEPIISSSNANSNSNSSTVLKIITFQQSSQVHPVICIDLQDKSLDQDWSSLFLASGRECAVVDLYASSDHYSRVLSASKPRHGTVTVASPILAAASSWPWVAVLQSDGLISIRSPSCLAIPLRTVEVGQRPNDYFVLRTAQTNNADHANPWIVATAFSGESKVLQCHPDSSQDLADRLMRHAIDAFGANGFPRSELAEAVGASFTSTSYVGPEASLHSKNLLKQYLEAVLGLADFECGGTSGWPTVVSHETTAVHHGTFAESTATNQRGTFGASSGAGSSSVTTAMAGATNGSCNSTPAALLCGTALLCLVCSQVTPPNSLLASRAAKACTEKMGVVFQGGSDNGIPKAATGVCELVAEKLLREASSKFSLITGSSPMPIARNSRSSQSSTITDFVESAIYLLRSCGKHERAIEVAHQRLQQQSGSQANDGSTNTSEASAGNVRGFWSQIKYESYTATHLSEIWGAGKDEGCGLVLKSPATHRLLENNPRLGLSVFTAMHPQNDSQWQSMAARDDPLAHSERVYEVLKLLKSINPAIPCDKDRSFSADDIVTLPLESGRAVAVSFLRSAVGISSGRPVDDSEFDLLPVDADFEVHVANFHDELSFLLLEGVISELPVDETNACDTELGRAYRSMLRELLKWPLAKIRPERFMESLPPTFLEEKALVLGRMGRYMDALRILYRDLDSLDLALEYCDDRFAQQKTQHERLRTRQHQKLKDMQHHNTNINMFPDVEPVDDFDRKEEDNAYLPLVRVALESEDSERGTATAIKVLALRRGAIDRAAALRLLPSEVPVSAVARPFLIPALVDSESQVRRLTVVSALLRSRYLRMKDELTAAQLKAQANIHVVPALRSLNLGDPLQSTKSFRARTTRITPGSTMPYVEIVKHFFPRHLVIQVRVTNAPYSSSSTSALYASDKTNTHQTVLTDIAFVVAESSEEEAIQPLLHVPIQVLPPKMTGSAWCVLSAAPNNMDGPTAQLTCELRYSVQSVDAAASAMPASIGLNSAVLGRTFVEELQDLEVQAAHFSPKLY